MLLLLKWKCKKCGLRYGEHPENGCCSSGCNSMDFEQINQTYEA